MKMIEQRDYDHLAKKLGYNSMQEVRAEREAEEKAAAIAKAEAEEKARLEAFRLEEEAKDLEINEALRSGRMLVKVDEQLNMEPADYHQIVCSQCGKELQQIRETLLCVKRRGSYRGELCRPEWFRAAAELCFDTIPCGPGDGLKVMAQHLLCSGQTICPHCSSTLNISIQVSVEHDGKRIPDLWSL